MRSSIKVLSLLAMLLAAPASFAALITGDVTGGGTFFGETSRNDAWASENPNDGTEINFWTFSGVAGNSLSVEVMSLLNNDGDDFDAAISLYFGVVTEADLGFGGFNFDNDAGFGSLTFVAGSSPFGTFGNNASLLDIILPTTGLYTIAIGGEGFLSFDDDYPYQMTVTAVPLPATSLLLVTGLLGMLGVRRHSA